MSVIKEDKLVYFFFLNSCFSLTQSLMAKWDGLSSEAINSNNVFTCSEKVGLTDPKEKTLKVIMHAFSFIRFHLTAGYFLSWYLHFRKRGKKSRIHAKFGKNEKLNLRMFLCHRPYLYKHNWFVDPHGQSKWRPNVKQFRPTKYEQKQRSTYL